MTSTATEPTTTTTGNPRMDELIELYGPPTSRYTLAQMIADGGLVKLPETMFGLPVYMTAAAHADCVAWSDEIEQRKSCYTGQDETGRMADVLTMARLYGKGHPNDDTYLFQLVRVPATGRGVMARKAVLRATLGGDDDGNPCVTIGMPNED